MGIIKEKNICKYVKKYFGIGMFGCCRFIRPGKIVFFLGNCSTEVVLEK
jgi:hypothetical protein